MQETFNYIEAERKVAVAKYRFTICLIVALVIPVIIGLLALVAEGTVPPWWGLVLLVLGLMDAVSFIATIVYAILWASRNHYLTMARIYGA